MDRLSFKKYIDALPNIHWTSAPDGTIDYINPEWEKYSGTNEPKNWHSFCHPDDLPKANALWSKSISLGIPYEIDMRLKNIDGKYQWFSTRANPVKNKSGKIIKWLGNTVNIDCHKKAQEQLKKITEYYKNNQKELREAKIQAESANESKSSFLASMSHEIRTPLSSILGFAKILFDQDELTRDQKNYLLKIVKNGRSLMNIINDILDLSKVESGRIQIEKIPIPLKTLITETVSLFQDSARQKKIRLINNICTDTVPNYIISDPTRIRQILINLIGNSVKFTDKGKITVSTFNKKIGDLNYLSFEVKDTGIGLSDKQAAKIFKPFTQADQTMTRKFGGTGLGLDLSKRLANALGGDVFLKSYSMGHGCTFVFSTIVNNASSEEIDELLYKGNKINTSPTKSLEGLKILVVDDSQDNVDLLKVILGQKKVKVDTAYSGLEALKKTSENEYDLVLMDIQMPELDGNEAMQHLRARNYNKPVIALTAHAMKEEIDKSLQCGFNDYATKPINFDSLYNKISNLLQ